MSQIRDLVDERSRAEGDVEQPIDDDGGLRVPWQVCTLKGRQLTAHYRTNAFHTFRRLELVEDPDQVRIAVVEGRRSDGLPGQHRSQAVTLAAPLADRVVIDDTTGRGRDVFEPDLDRAWRALDVAVAEWLLAGDALSSLRDAANSALIDGCESSVLPRMAAGAEDMEPLYRERGLRCPDLRAAAKLVVDAALEQAEQNDAYAESIAFVLDRAATSANMDADLRAQLAELLALGRDIETSLAETGDSTEASATFLAAARALRARGGLAI